MPSPHWATSGKHSDSTLPVTPTKLFHVVTKWPLASRATRTPFVDLVGDDELVAERRVRRVVGPAADLLGRGGVPVPAHTTNAFP